MPLAIGLTMLVSAALGSTASASSTGPVIAATLPQPQTVRQYVRSYFADIPIMVDIAYCESHFHQYEPNGSIYLGEVDNQDIGVMQINEHYHGAEAKAMGIDITTIEGNVAFARALYEKEGTAPWSSSEKCWNPDLTTASTSKALAVK